MVEAQEIEAISTLKAALGAARLFVVVRCASDLLLRDVPCAAAGSHLRCVGQPLGALAAFGVQAQLICFKWHSGTRIAAYRGPLANMGKYRKNQNRGLEGV